MVFTRSLIFKRIPDDLLYTEDDINKYKSMFVRRTRTNTSIIRKADYWAIEDTSTNNHAVDIDHIEETEEIWKEITSRNDTEWRSIMCLRTILTSW